MNLMVGRRLRALGVCCVVLSGVTPAAGWFPTPRWELECNTWVTGGLGSYYGHATCRETADTEGLARWKIRVDCTLGMTYDSRWRTAGIGSATTAAGPCWFGVNSVDIIEGR